MRHLVVSLSKLDIETETVFRDHLGEQGYGFWHRLPGIWLVVTPDDVGPFEFREQIFKLFVLMVPVFIAEVSDGQTAVGLPSGSAAWFTKHWNMPIRNWHIDSESEKEEEKIDATQE
jgi:hypothetical protein